MRHVRLFVYSSVLNVQVLEAAEFLGSGIIYKGIHATNTSRIGIYSKNTPQVSEHCSVHDRLSTSTLLKAKYECKYIFHLYNCEYIYIKN